MQMMHGRAKAKGDMVGLEELIAQYGPAPPDGAKSRTLDETVILLQVEKRSRPQLFT
ncbi:hypothetical protein CPB84DRAFT_1848134 [Gymnopilus junonius]|uniref:Uncharacterized protein n=1 Tax=Gymnopilus junonius TaxID=109634 RepID=A0A9P5NMG0_GYMJU|nr:hypothetical protein CPB84DRAFT_1848134 [Gymnopilus junonius]